MSGSSTAYQEGSGDPKKMVDRVVKDFLHKNLRSGKDFVWKNLNFGGGNLVTTVGN